MPLGEFGGSQLDELNDLQRRWDDSTMEYLGGTWWKCKRCGATIQAPCSCCEPAHRCAPVKK